MATSAMISMVLILGFYIVCVGAMIAKILKGKK
jgi:hypothetical protein